MLTLPVVGEVEGAPALLLAWAVIFVMNAVTFPLPPAWTVMAAFRTYAQVPLLPLTVGGSAVAALGRLLYARQVRMFTNRLPADARSNAEAISAAAHSRLGRPWVFVAVYSFLPVSSDPVFMAVGMGALETHSTVTAYFVARSILNTLMVVAAGPAVANLGELFAGRFGWRSILVVVLSAAIYALFLKLPWARWLHVQTAGGVS